MKLANACALVLLLGSGACASDEADGSATFDGECSAAGAACAKVSLRWTVDRYGKDATCANVGATTVVATAKFQADGRVATFEASCTAGALLSSPMPVGPYQLDIVLTDASDAALSHEMALTTLGVSNTVAETMVAFNVVPAIAAGDTFGACSASAPCKMSSDLCNPLAAGRGYCAPRCTSGTECGRAYAEYLEDFDGTVRAYCLPIGPDDGSPSGCAILCGSQSENPCAAGNHCATLPDNPLEICQP